MYLDFYGLCELPFELTPNPNFLYLAPGHREALANVQYGLATAKAVTVLTGEAGTGKTTLIRTALASESCRNVRCMHLTNPQLTRDEFVETLARGFSMSPEAFRSKATLLAELEQALRDRREGGEVLAGGSTITQQVVRNVLFEPEYRAERSVQRKVEEILLAFLLRQRKSPQEVLELYLNESYYGNLAYGAQAAALTFFNKNVQDLTLAESALLAGLPQAPAIRPDTRPLSESIAFAGDAEQSCWFWVSPCVLRTQA